MKEPTICLTGGHLTPAIAVIEEIQKQHLPWKLMFIGRRQAFEGGGSPAHEERLVTSLGVSFHGLIAGRFPRSWSPVAMFSLLKVPVGFVQALWILLRHRPTMIVSFGGYIALPVVMAAWFLGIGYMTHEQTEDLGLANAMIARFARSVLLARKSGVPIRSMLFHPPKQSSFSVEREHPILYITGGSTGAQSLNALIFPLVRELTMSFTLVHQVGAADLEKAHRIKESLSPQTRGRYVIADYFDTPDLAWIYHHLSLLVGRAGANTVAETAALGIPSLFIPLPWAAADEQTKNAQQLVHEGMAVVCEQSALTAWSLLVQIQDMVNSIEQYKNEAIRIAKHYPRDGAAMVVKEIQRLMTASS
ncbi:MAG: glycosyltransferase [Patescibacteria group bacterium]